MTKRILDPCCGSRMFWFNKQNPDVEFCDNRELHTQLCDGRKLDIKPDTFADFTNLPFADETFYHIVFDPPAPCNTWQKLLDGKEIRCSPGRLMGICAA